MASDYHPKGMRIFSQINKFPSYSQNLKEAGMNFQQIFKLELNTFHEIFFITVLTYSGAFYFSRSRLFFLFKFPILRR